MRKIIVLLVIILSTEALLAQNKDYKVIFDMSSKDTVNHQTVIREIMLIRKANPDAKLEVVVYGQGLDLVLKDKSTKGEAIQELAKDPNVSFRVCAMTMQRNNVDESGLVAGVRPVADGIYEIVTRQQEGWGYIKVAH
jgi:intracellular sulfur oxidation DsrE/DsrF family protein